MFKRAKGSEDAEPVIAALRDRGVLRSELPDTVGVVSFRVLFGYNVFYMDVFFHQCLQVKKNSHLFAAKVVFDLGKSDQYIQARVMLHPARIIVNDFKEARAPMAVSMTGFPHLNCSNSLKMPSPLNLRYRHMQVDAYAKIFPRVVHGWAVRSNDEDKVAAKGAQEAQKDTLDWFHKHLK
ncbi:hypothetical protein MLD38_033051 [Melastoma candidum]|uniref:Uncharacterized protein n=1 Tax=Melastoma candidum TaxID=119954 RepID=A0ACB9M6T0_9MYRT|nr:hypothetical protein MLD38_033051 [Melastoma candidum]